MIKAIIFDYGNVIHKWDNDIFLNKIVKKSDKNYDYIVNFIFGLGLHDKFELGKIQPAEFFSTIKKGLNLKLSQDEFFRAYNSKLFQEIGTTISLIKKLKKYYKVALLSTTNKINFEYVLKKSEVFPLFDAVTLSFEVEHKKPEKEIYLDALKKLNLKPKECVFIDDIKEYSDAALKLGIHGIHYTSYENLIKELKKLNVEI